MNQVIAIQYIESAAYAYEVHGEVYAKGYKYAFASHDDNTIFVSKEEIPEEYRPLFEDIEGNKGELMLVNNYDVIPFSEYLIFFDERMPF